MREIENSFLEKVLIVKQDSILEETQETLNERKSLVAYAFLRWKSKS